MNRICCLALCWTLCAAGIVYAAKAEKDGAGHHPHIGEANASKSLEDPAAIPSDLAFWNFVVFLILLAVLWKFAWGPIAAALDKRENHIAENIAAAERAGDDARKLLSQYEAKLAGAADEVRQLLEEARRDAEHTRLEIVAQAKTEAQAEHARRMREIEMATDQALKQIAETGANLAIELASKIVRRQLTHEDHAVMIKEAVAKFVAPSRN